MIDIVERLRTLSGAHEWDRGRNEMLDAAADEIEKLRRDGPDVTSLIDENFRLSQALRSIAVGKMTASDAAYVARTATNTTFPHLKTEEGRNGR